MSRPGNWIFVQDIEQLKEHIQKGEALARAAWILAPAFIDATAVERMGLVNIDKALETFRIALRDFLCCELEQKLKDQESHPLPTQADIDKMMQPPPDYFKRQKPPVEILIRAQESVALLENAIAKIEELPDGHPMRDLAGPTMLPYYQIQLQQAQTYLSQIQAAMEEPDEAAQPPMSNEVPSVEAESPGEAKEKD